MEKVGVEHHAVIFALLAKECILAKGKAEAEAILEAARQKAQKETEKTMALYAIEAEKAKSKELSAADMQAKKQVLAKKQQLIE